MPCVNQGELSRHGGGFRRVNAGQAALGQLRLPTDARQRRLEVVRGRGEELLPRSLQVLERRDVLEDAYRAHDGSIGLTQRRGIRQYGDILTCRRGASQELLAAHHLSAPHRTL